MKAGIWGGKMDPNPHYFYDSNSTKIDVCHSKGSELVDTDTNWWDFQRLRDNFSMEEVRAIASIPKVEWETQMRGCGGVLILECSQFVVHII